jgi:hypothetical protein
LSEVKPILSHILYVESKNGMGKCRNVGTSVR